MNSTIYTVYAVALFIAALIVGITMATLWYIDISKLEGELGKKKLGLPMVGLVLLILGIGFMVGGCPPLTGISQWPWQSLKPSYLKAPILTVDFSVDSTSKELKLLKDAPEGQMWVIDPRTGQPFFSAKDQKFADCTSWRIYFQNVSNGEVSPAVPVTPGK